MEYYFVSEECAATVERCKATEKEGEALVKEILNKIKNAKAIKEAQLKEATKQLELCKKKALETRSKWDGMQQVWYINVFYHKSNWLQIIHHHFFLPIYYFVMS